MIYHPLYGMNNYVLIWGDWLSCDPLRGSHNSQSPYIYMDILVPQLVATLIYLSQIYSYYIRGDRSPLTTAPKSVFSILNREQRCRFSLKAFQLGKLERRRRSHTTYKHPGRWTTILNYDNEMFRLIHSNISIRFVTKNVTQVKGFDHSFKQRFSERSGSH